MSWAPWHGYVSRRWCFASHIHWSCIIYGILSWKYTLLCFVPHEIASGVEWHIMHRCRDLFKDLPVDELSVVLDRLGCKKHFYYRFAPEYNHTDKTWAVISEVVIYDMHCLHLTVKSAVHFVLCMIFIA